MPSASEIICLSRNSLWCVSGPWKRQMLDYGTPTDSVSGTSHHELGPVKSKSDGRSATHCRMEVVHLECSPGRDRGIRFVSSSTGPHVTHHSHTRAPPSAHTMAT